MSFLYIKIFLKIFCDVEMFILSMNIFCRKRDFFGASLKSGQIFLYNAGIRGVVCFHHIAIMSGREGKKQKYWDRRRNIEILELLRLF